MRTLSALLDEHFDCYVWHRRISPTEADVLVYESRDDMYRDRDNSLAIARETVRLDITSHPCLYDDDDIAWDCEQ